jgi:hypothetical protein
MSNTSDVTRLIEAFDADGFIKGEAQLEETPDPA